MTTFNDLLALDGAARVWLLEVSFDGFATISFQWATEAIAVGAQQFEGRIVMKGSLARGLGRDNLPQSSRVNFLVDNTDFAADWLVDRGTVASQVFKARFRLTLALYDPSLFYSSAPAVQTKVMGTFKCLDRPARDSAAVTLVLSDDLMGTFDTLRSSPSIRDWVNDPGSSDINCPLLPHAGDSYRGCIPAIDWETPTPLAWGSVARAWLIASDYAIAPGAGAGDSAAGNPFSGAFPLVVCATTSPANVTPDDLVKLVGTFSADCLLLGQPYPGAGRDLDIPKTFAVPRNGQVGPPGVTITIWEPRKTQTITRDGASWKLLWVNFNAENYLTWFTYANNLIFEHGSDSPAQTTGNAPVSPASAQRNANTGSYYSAKPSSLGGYLGAFAYFTVVGNPLSARGNPSSPQVGLDVIQDLFSYYSRGSTADVDSARFDAARLINSIAVRGTVQPTQPNSADFKYSKVNPIADALKMGDLRAAIAEIARSIDVDIFLTWDGKIAVSSGFFTLASLTATRVNIDETRCSGIVERTPSKGERWAPYNRLYVVGADGALRGPYDNSAAVVAWGAIVERTIEGKWLINTGVGPGIELSASTAWQLGARVEAKVRPLIKFKTDRLALQLELTDQLNFTWTRGGNTAVYSAAAFQVESMSIEPDTLAVTVEAIWVADSEAPFLLDDEAMCVVVSSTPGRTCTVQDAFALATFSSGDLIADGLQAGDVLVLKDATQAPNVFTRYRAIRITTPDATQPRMDNSDLAFGAPAGAAVVDWEIRRGATSYGRLEITDPADYPSGTSRLYGKASNDSDNFSDASLANRLL